AEAENAQKVARTVKSLNKETVVILGGHHASSLPESFLRETPDVDYIVHGEGELTLAELVERIDGGQDVSDVQGIAYRRGDSVVVTPRRELIADLDALPLPARNKLDLNKYIPRSGTGNYLQLPTTGIMASRGCPYQCHFCSKGVWGTTIRFRSVESVIEEIQVCMKDYGIRDFRFYDDALTLPKWELSRFCETLIRLNLGITWNCYSRVNHINEEKLRLMKRAGCYHVKYGLEFGTEKALKLANKAATLEQARTAVALTKKVGLECKGNFMLGIPGETLEDCQTTISFAIELSPDLASFYPFDLIPGSEFYRRLKTGDPSVGSALPKALVQRMSERAYLRFYVRGGYIKQRLARLLMHPARESKVLGSGVYMMTRFFMTQILNQLVGVLVKRNGKRELNQSAK
ncbi:MAG TPA: radical SAM protein, partial [bacterium]|nr:radical SAM protein [bacterium]